LICSEDQRESLDGAPATDQMGSFPTCARKG
jgi:hypothetical protein